MERNLELIEFEEKKKCKFRELINKKNRKKVDSEINEEIIKMENRE
jgi:hypothetical protein